MGGRAGSGARGSSRSSSAKLSPNMVTGYNEASRKVVQGLAKEFLNTADKLASKVSAYIDGSNKKSDKEAYEKVKKLNADFNKAYSKYTGQPYMEPALDYDLAESVL